MAPAPGATCVSAKKPICSRPVYFLTSPSMVLVEAVNRRVATVQTGKPLHLAAPGSHCQSINHMAGHVVRGQSWRLVSPRHPCLGMGLAIKGVDEASHGVNQWGLPWNESPRLTPWHHGLGSHPWPSVESGQPIKSLNSVHWIQRLGSDGACSKLLLLC